MRIVFDANASTIRFCPATPGAPGACTNPSPWPFTLDGVAGSLDLPRFGAVMTTSGDVTSAAVPLTLTLGAATVTVPVAFSTGLVLADGVVVEGAPLQGAGSWVLVGALAAGALPAPLTGHTLALTLPCPPRPVPDKDQFVPASVVQRIGGRVAPTGTRLRATVVLGPADRPVVGQGPLLMALHVDNTTIATAAVESGLVGRPHPTGTSTDGRTTVTARRRTAQRISLTIQMHDVTVPALAPGTRALVGLTLQTPGLLARGERLFHADAAGTGLGR